MIKAEIICHSINIFGDELVTYLLTYPRFIHAEVLRHRALSFCAQSSRARPISKVLKDAWSNTATPVEWGQNNAGMQSNKKLPKHKQWLAQKLWMLSCSISIVLSWLMSKLGVHKQISNRITEPYSHITHIVSGTDWGNFFNLRCHPDAQPEFQELAAKMLEVLQRSTPILLKPGEWHLPFGDRYTDDITDIKEKIKVCTARCARTSYLNFNGSYSKEEDIKLHDRLLDSKHFSPFEFCAEAMSFSEKMGNYKGFRQYRKLLPNENQERFDIGTLLEKRNAKRS